MICKNCGRNLNEGELFCTACGQKVEAVNNNLNNAQPMQNVNTNVQPIATPMQNINVNAQPIETPIQNANVNAQPIETPMQNVNVNAQPIETPMQNVNVNAQPMETPMQNVNVNAQPMETPMQNVNVNAQPMETPIQNANVNTQPIETPMQNVNVNAQPIETPIQNVNANMQPMQAASQNMNTTQTNNNSKKTAFIIGVVVLGIIIVALLIFISVKLVGGVLSKKTSNRNITTNAITTTNIGGQNVSSGETFTIGNFTFSVPSDMTYTEQSGQIVVSDKANTVAFSLDIGAGMMSVYKNNIDSIKSTLQSRGMVINTSEVTEYDGIEYIVLKGSYSGQDVIYYVCPVTDRYLSAGLVAMNGIDETSAFSKLSQIIKSAKETGKEDLSKEFSITLPENDVSNFLK